MKRGITLLIALVCIFGFSSCGTKSIENYNEYCYYINNLIKDINFDKGNVSDGKIILFDDEKEVYNQEYDKYDDNYKIKYIRKEENKIFFVINASVNDDDGIVFVNDSSDDIMDGLWSLERVSGNSYKYKTYK